MSNKNTTFGRSARAQREGAEMVGRGLRALSDVRGNGNRGAKWVSAPRSITTGRLRRAFNKLTGN